jgi:hypothetical protein
VRWFAVPFLLLACAGSDAAPLPPPRSLTAEMFVGSWAYQWGYMKDGWITFTDDGLYFSSHHPSDQPSYVGWYEARGNVLTLHESRFAEGDPRSDYSTEYPVTIRLDRYPALVGQNRSGEPVVFSKTR